MPEYTPVEGIDIGLAEEALVPLGYVVENGVLKRPDQFEVPADREQDEYQRSVLAIEERLRDATAGKLEYRLCEMMVERLFLQVKPWEIGYDDQIQETLEVDSVTALEIVVGIEEDYGISMEDDDFDMENFMTVRAIAAYAIGKGVAETGIPKRE